MKVKIIDMDHIKIIQLNNYGNLFNDLYYSVSFENVMNGRQGAKLVDSINGYYSLVRTATEYTRPSQLFPCLYRDLMDDIITTIKQQTDISNIRFNNALVEVYDTNYKNMQYHSGPSVDLQNSYICIFSCYPKNNKIERQLLIRNKQDQDDIQVIKLENNSCILFSTEFNKLYQHKIIYPSNSKSNTDKWLGITFRLSKTFVYYSNDIPYLKSGKLLRSANDIDKAEFIKHKSNEYYNVGYTYPDIDYTLSIGDLLPVR